MAPPEHVHHRETDIPGKMVIPRWVFQAVGALAAIIGTTLFSLGWLDSRYASKSDVQSIQTMVQDVSSDVKEIRRTLDDKFSK